MKNKSTLIYGSFIVVCFLFVTFAFNDWLTAERLLSNATRELSQASQMVQEIAVLKGRPRMASLAMESPQRTIERIAEAQRKWSLPPDSLTSVAPSAPTRIGNSDYQLRLTELQLRDVSLDSLASFASELTASQEGLLVRELSITPDREPDTIAGIGPELWQVRLVLTQLIYSPKSN